MNDEQAQARLPQVVCVLRDPEGAIAGANSAFESSIPLIGGRRFWIYRSLIPGGSDETWERMLLACFDALASEFGPGSPVGVFAPVADPELPERMPEAIWPLSGFSYAGFTAEGRQARIRYFPEGRI